jgi:uncharacterized protein (TIGR03067 family)
MEVFMLMYRVGVCLAVLTVVFSGTSTTAAEPENTIDEALLKQLQGEWEVVESIFDGKSHLNEQNKWTFVIKGRKAAIHMGSGSSGTLEMKLLVQQGTLGHIDYEIQDAASKRVRIKQLFKLEGDTLTTCVHPPPGSDRPRELTSTPGSGNLLTVSKRKP